MLFVVISLKPLLFALNFTLARWYQYASDFKNPRYNEFIVRALKYNPISHKNIDIIRFMKTAVYYKKKEYIERLPVDFKQLLKQIYKYNFYYHDLMENLVNNRKWKHLDELSLEIMSNPDFNPISQRLINKIRLSLSRKISLTLYDYLNWKGNHPIRELIGRKCQISERDVEDMKVSSISQKKSLHKLQDILSQQLITFENQLGKNLMENPRFNDCDLLVRRSFINHRYNKRIYFVSGLDFLDKNMVLRISSFFLPKSDRSKFVRVLYGKLAKLEKKLNRYCLSFDYMTRSLETSIILRCGDKGKKVQIPATHGKWCKATFFSEEFIPRKSWAEISLYLKGTGSIFIDNLYLSEFIKGSPPQTNYPDQLIIEKYK